MKNSIQLFIATVLLTQLSFSATSQEVLDLQSYLQAVTQNYPLFEKANLYDAIEEAYVLKGRGAFDPKIDSDYNRKRFSDTDYFSIWQTELKVPTRLPVDLSVGYERNEGDFLNSENSVPNNGLIYGSLNMSLLRGLMFDEQRYKLKSAELLGLKSQIEQSILVREIMNQAISSYLDWSVAYLKNSISRDYFLRMQERQQNVRELFIGGDKPAVDTLEYSLYLNTANAYYLESQQTELLARQQAALFLWSENGEPLEILQDVQPQALQTVVEEVQALASNIATDFQTDPLVQKIDNQMEQVENRNRLEKEQRKPRLDLKYNAISNLGKEDLDPSFSLNDYKYGVKFEMPLRNRKARGEIALNDLKIEQYKLDRINYTQVLQNKFQRLTANVLLQEALMDVVLQKVESSQQLYDVEVIKFDLGESSVFMLNQRERNLLDTQIELSKAYEKLGKTLTKLYYLKLGQQENI